MNYVFLGILAFSIVLVVLYYFKNKARLDRFFGEVRVEMSKVGWPKMQEVVDSTVLVGVTVIILTIACGFADKGLSTVLQLFVF